MPASPSYVQGQTSSGPRPVPSNEWRPFGRLRCEIDRLFVDLTMAFWASPSAAR